MINRDYLRYKSAREYVDRGMAKWMGFFISEHTTALKSIGDEIDFSNRMDEEEIPISLSQVYLNSLKVMIYTTGKVEPLIGKISDLSNGKIYFRTEEKISSLSPKQILKITLMEDII